MYISFRENFYKVLKKFNCTCFVFLFEWHKWSKCANLRWLCVWSTWSHKQLILHGCGKSIATTCVKLFLVPIHSMLSKHNF